MSNLKEIKGRIHSVQNTRQITKAMKMVSAVKLRKAQDHILQMRPYAYNLKAIMKNIGKSQKVEDPLLNSSKTTKKLLLVVWSSDRGLCGAFNSSISRFTESYYKKERPSLEKLDFLFIGKKSIEYLQQKIKLNSRQIIDTITGLDKEICFSLAKKISETLIGSYHQGNYDEVRLIYNEFKSVLSQEVVCERLLPLEREKLNLAEENQSENQDEVKNMLCEPHLANMITPMLHQYFSLEIYRCMSESVAAEHGARMTAMENATKNADEMMTSLNLQYNKLRQASITTELIEITSGAEALQN